MAKKQTKKNSVEIGRNIQLAFILAVILTWFAPVVYMLIWLSTGYSSTGTRLIQLSYIGLPVVFLGLAMLYIRGKYAQKLHFIFMSILYAMIGVSIYGAIASIENALRYKFYPPKITDYNDTSLLTAFGHEWLLMGIGLVVFAVSLVMLNWKRKI